MHYPDAATSCTITLTFAAFPWWRAFVLLLLKRPHGCIGMHPAVYCTSPPARRVALALPTRGLHPSEACMCQRIKGVPCPCSRAEIGIARHTDPSFSRANHQPLVLWDLSVFSPLPDCHPLWAALADDGRAEGAQAGEMDGYTWFTVLSSSLSGSVWKIIKEIFCFSLRVSYLCDGF